LRWFAVTLVVLFGIYALTLSLFHAACLRYEVEFLQPLVWLAVLGILSLERAPAGRLLSRRGTRGVWGMLLGISVLFSVLAAYGLYAGTYVVLGRLYADKDQVAEAQVQYQRALELQPYNQEAQNGLGLALVRQGRAAEGVRHLEEALRLTPEDAQVHNNLGEAMIQLGRVAEAVGYYQRALRLKPDFANAHHNLAVVLFRQGRMPEALGHLEEALRSEPENGEVQGTLGMVLLRIGRVPEAIGHLEQALRLKPENAKRHYNLGLALVQTGRTPEGIGHLQEAIRLKPEYAESCHQAAWGLATSPDPSLRNGAQAVVLAELANQLAGGKDAGVMDTLAAAYAEVGRFGDAVRVARAVLELAKQSGAQEETRRIQERLQSYEAGRPYRAGPASGRQ
jgi:tetratricopeptide (TPR) repeat protein